MGISYNLEDRLAHVILMVPDGRIIAIQGREPSFMKRWRVTVSRRIVPDYDGSEPKAIEVAEWGVYTHFGVRLERLKKGCFELISSSYVARLDKTMELFLCKVPAGMVLSCSRYLKVKVVTLEEILNGISKNPGDFSLETIHALNLVSGLGASLEK